MVKHPTQFTAYSARSGNGGQMLVSRRTDSGIPGAADDYRRQSPRFQGENFATNLELVERVTAIAATKGITAGQLRDEGYEEIASAVDELSALAAGPVTAEEHLAATPDATPEEISFLQAAWQVLKAKRTADPFGPD